MNQPSYMPNIFWPIYLDMDAREKLTLEKRNFFLNKELKNFWVKAGEYIGQLDLSCGKDSDVASWFVGCFFTPLDLYNASGTVDKPSVKTNIRNNQIEADKLIKTALTLTSDLIDVLQKVEDATGHYPEELNFLTLIESMGIDDITLPNNSSPSWKIPTIDALTKLTHGLADHPEMADIFKNSPGMIGQKSSWVDWLTEAENQICKLQESYPGTLNLTDNDWANVFCALIDPNIDAKTARDNYLKSALAKIKKDKLQKL